MIPTIKQTRTLFLTAFLGTLLVLVPMSLAADSTATSSSWPRWGGPNMDFSVDGVEISSSPALETVWQRQLGSSFAGMVITDDGKLITGFSDGESDFLVALSTRDGKEIWRHRVAETYKGRDGSSDGILATPALDDQAAYVVSGWGHIAAVRSKDGEPLWERRLDKDFKGAKPHFGFTTSPLVVGELVVVQAGGTEGNSIVALDRKTGKERWASGDEKVSYQSPSLLQLGEELQVLAVNDSHLTGLDATTGKELWRHPHGEGVSAGSAQPVQLGDNAILLNYQSGVQLLHIKKQGDAYTVEEKWVSQALRRSYNVPVLHEGYLYGYNSRFLTCVDASNGERVWRSRPPGAGGLILVDGHLLIFGGEGNVVLVEASPEGYKEKARAKALELSSLTAPSFASSQIFVRNLEGIASVRLTETESSPQLAQDVEFKGQFGAFVQRLQKAENKEALLDEFMAEQKSFPIFEGDELVHLVFRGDVEDLAVRGNLNRDREVPMHHVEGTDFFFRSFELEPGTSHSYRFLVFEKSMTDPLNPHKAGPEGRERSLLHMPGWTAPEYLAKESTNRGKIEEWTWKSESLGNERPVKTYLPPGYAKGTKDFPLLLVYQGQQAVDFGKLDQALDHLIEKGEIEPIVAAFVSRQRWVEHAGSQTHKFASAVASELLPELVERYGVSKKPDHRAVWGTEAGAFAALFIALDQPDAFGKVIVQSYVDGGLQKDLEALISSQKSPFDLYIEWSRNDILNPSFGYDASAQTQVMAEKLAKAKNRVRRGEVGDSPGWESWITRTGQILAAFFPAR